MIDDWDLGRFTVRCSAFMTGAPAASSERLHFLKPEQHEVPQGGSLSPALQRPPKSHPQSFVGLFVMLLLVVYHYAAAPDAPAARRNQ